MVPRRIYISAPYAGNLDEFHRSVKADLVKRLQDAGYDLQEFSDLGLAQGRNWTFDNADEVMRRCQGAVIMVLPRFVVRDGDEELLLPTEYNHFEGALAVAHRVPRLIVVAAGIPRRGIASQAGDLFVNVPRSPDWVAASRLENRFAAWRKEVDQRTDVFLAYSSEAKATAQAVNLYLRSLGATVLDWAMDFQSGGTILEEVAQAVEGCRCGIFLFTESDKLDTDKADKAAPRDNVVFEAGFFMRAKGKERTLIIREAGAKMPTDLGGVIYAHLQDRDDISTIETRLRKFLEDRL